MKGIHNNRECVGCGACCVYFAIAIEDSEEGDSPRVFKKAGEVCDLLEYDPVSKRAFCSDYDNRPEACREFGCFNIGLSKREKTSVEMRDIAKKIKNLKGSGKISEI